MRAGWAKLSIVLLGLGVLAGCATDTRYDDPAKIAAARYVHDGPPALELYTMINARSGAGAHTSLLINGSERIIFDPAGSVSFSSVPERADVLFGVTPEVKRAYASAHARSTFYVTIQRIEVSRDVAQQALQLAVNNGAVSQAYCANATSSLLAKLPGFEGIKTTFYPQNLRAQFAAIPGVTERVLRENDEDDKTIAIQRLERQLAQ
ncbi:hypothetical protein [Primorskyibacter sp. S187A]|uniref:hypothetical protein n=1 Tax=Primorskyibacter sp. S187A TaxID=3415130 RepID=UPI003C7E1164